jgi:hypothetical protein
VCASRAASKALVFLSLLSSSMPLPQTVATGAVSTVAGGAGFIGKVTMHHQPGAAIQVVKAP